MVNRICKKKPQNVAFHLSNIYLIRFDAIFVFENINYVLQKLSSGIRDSLLIWKTTFEDFLCIFYEFCCIYRITVKDLVVRN